MPIETATYINELNAAYPDGDTDAKATLDDHIQLVKAALQNTFPGLTGAVTSTQAELNILDGATVTTAQLNQLAATLTGSRALATTAGGVLTSSAVTSTELGYLSGVTSAIQTQLNAKENTISLTASRAVVSSAGGALAASAATSTEVGYLSGVTSAIQTQLDAKQATITGAATTVVSSDLTASRALISSGTGKIAVHSTVSDTELGYLNGVTSAIQTQLDGKRAEITAATGSYIYDSASRTYSNMGATLAKEVEWICPAAGTYNFRLTLGSDSGQTVSARIYRNGSPVGTLRSTTTTSDTNEDISGWSVGDSMEFWCADTGSMTGSATVYIRHGTGGIFGRIDY